MLGGEIRCRYHLQGEAPLDTRGVMGPRRSMSWMQEQRQQEPQRPLSQEKELHHH